MTKTTQVIIIICTLLLTITLISATLFIYAANENIKKDLQTSFTKRDELIASGQQLQIMVNQLNDTLTAEQQKQKVLSELVKAQNTVTNSKTTPTLSPTPQPIVQPTPQPVPQPVIVPTPKPKKTRAS